MTGPLSGIRVIEMAGRGPGPFAAMLLADMGADIIRVDRPDEELRAQSPDPQLELVSRGRRSVGLNLKTDEARDILRALIARADVLVEGFRPGVMERLGVGPEYCLSRSPQLVYARLTGWGQSGPLAERSGHDINYIALAGALDPIGRFGEPPTVPLNLVGDYAGGGMLAAFGVVAALLHARETGEGQVIDAAMIDGASLLMTAIHGRRAMGVWRDERGTNFLDSGAPFYDVYRTSDDKYMSVGSIEAKFYDEFVRLLGIPPERLPERNREHWSALRGVIADAFRTAPRSHWERVFAGSDACVTPVLSLAEAPMDPHNRARRAFVELDGVTYPAPAPRLEKTPAAISSPPPRPGQHSNEVLSSLGLGNEEIARARAMQAVF